MTTTDRSLPTDLPNQLLIGGRWVDADESRTFDVIDPATEDVLISIADAGEDQGLDALTAAVDAQDAWAATAPRERAEILRRGWEIVTERKDDFARLMTLEMGKPLAEAYGEVTYGAEFLRWFSEEAVRIRGDYGILPEGKVRQLVMKRPVGPCLFITPWNFPLAMATRKSGPALAAGCTVIIRPASSTPLTTLLFAKAMQDAGLPDGVLNVITGLDHGVTDKILADPRLRKLSFTGSTPVGRHLLSQASEHVLRTSMELGGNAPFIVFEDADVDAAVEGAKGAKMRNMGEACISANRFIVHESVAEEFTEKFTAYMSGLVVGDGMEKGTDVGPIIGEGDRQKINALVESARNAGGTVLTGGEIPSGRGYFYPPTVITGVPADAEVMTTEIFGPVAPITTFSTEEEALRIANSVPVGLAGYVYTRDVDRIQRMGAKLETGMVGANIGVFSNAAAPFGGVKESGLGREGSYQGIEEFLETIYVALPNPA
ncbi:MAG: NAD-dependent succinate-semialdehyde dehydrogenase [Acidipropionibacterium acidipropionici]|jgi:succinate-semialdehyde dehydrogenase/glutarate-semialdehyde dehydrogenase|nr:NAD-dependent succinate-semialdehyde dehydrogenase [Acidipropionibacterium acidipropionici]AMS05897.1 NAD-dependent succinate-semialdehyde dehydrogenase [Acidipropionibacterium acidipropionici]AOZ47361.1 NAD-dependent succinate-semialdehyde dehydrogenase [Acidipropionibacterium acidipropionici]AZP36529.1 NAD-dependent succinate-semialdehyde dehydrogenase [Acidipropionibacterium acidipropionici]QCV96317.1 NAD-dependent succinate-semialdehyde dehydrogenase [Acidipropionibacterium acidipropioni